MSFGLAAVLAAMNTATITVALVVPTLRRIEWQLVGESRQSLSESDR